MARRLRHICGMLFWLAICPLAAAQGVATTRVISLDGQWRLAVDPQNVGREQGWQRSVRPEAKLTKVPWIIQDAFPGYHGVAWYWREFVAPANPHPGGRTLLRFWAVDYKAEVWLNGTRLGEHEDGETQFVFDVTDAVRPGQPNQLAVRVLNPANEPIDGITLNETAHGIKVLPYQAGRNWNKGGICDSVELLVLPAVWVEDLFVRPDWKTGILHIQASVHHAGAKPVGGHLEFTAAPAAGGETLSAIRIGRELPSGDTPIETQFQIPNPRRWELSDPFLYRVTLRVRADGSDSFDEHSVRCGFRDFRFQDGYFRFSGRRIYLRCSHTANCCPIGLEMPHDPDLLRRDLLNVKAMGFNAIRFIDGVAKRYQLDLCDEIGLMVYEESYASWLMENSPRMPERYDRSVLGMVRRDRSHPSVVMWGLLNETPDGPIFRHAVGLLPALRALDDSRLVMLNSGRWDRVMPRHLIPGIDFWRNDWHSEPWVGMNPTKETIKALGITWPPGQLAFHPGPNGEYSAVRWTAPAAGKWDLAATFHGIAERATTDVHVLHNGRPLLDGSVNVKGGGNSAKFSAPVAVQTGDTIDFAVGYGNGNYGADTTALTATLKSAEGKTCAAAKDFGKDRNPNGPWSYGWLAPGAEPKAATFALYAGLKNQAPIGSLSNPGSTVWEDMLSDQHPYQRVPHTASIIRALRTLDGSGQPVFLSEYGIGSAVDLIRVVRHYEQLGKASVEDAQFYRARRGEFLADWQRWRMGEAFARPEDFFEQSLARMGGQRLLGLNAIRANPNVISHSLTGTVDQVMCGEGLTTTFRELKPGTVDAVFDALAPLRWCLFAEPVNVYRKTPVRLEAVLANEDVLAPGKYPARLQVFGPDGARVFERTVTVTIPDPRGKPEPPMVKPVFAEDVAIDGLPGKYRFLATFERGAAAAGGEAEFYVADPAQMPAVECEVALWGEDPGLAKWLAEHGVRTRPFSTTNPVGREVILASASPPTPGGAVVFRELARRIAQGSTAVFLSPAVFAQGDQPTAWLPLPNKGTVAGLPSWLYHKDEWAKPHPIFEGLPAGGLMDYTFYRDIIPDAVWTGQTPPAEAVAGANNAAVGYSSGLLVAVFDLGAGRFVLNTLRIRENLGPDPVAERLLRNLLRYAARDLNKPAVNLPADFEGQLKAMGY